MTIWFVDKNREYHHLLQGLRKTVNICSGDKIWSVTSCWKLVFHTFVSEHCPGQTLSHYALISMAMAVLQSVVPLPAQHPRWERLRGLNAQVGKQTEVSFFFGHPGEHSILRY